ncbi:hypothetical protein GCM10010289_83810 [Streptomyces violascens]|uniref:HTH marR-type domain-containing protein n=1 Tax=Streptomyces violascens TaxID=67381 RepID=A0ABQ3QSE1_9ACTN|nr:hypothetical protein GCM10010289_83810 [Streptomyces violascens]GHI40184.1 hypothetical protein Sviol_45920 [Streptomyces violascens]
MEQQAGGWGSLTNHAHELLAIARDPVARIRDIAAACHITECTAQRIVGDLEQAGYLSREREGQHTPPSTWTESCVTAESRLPVQALLVLCNWPRGSLPVGE